MPTGLREIILDAFDMSLGTGLGRMKGKIFRIGHLGHFNDLMLCGTLCGVEMGLHRAGIPHRAGGVAAALEFLGARRRRGRPTIASGAAFSRGRSGPPPAWSGNIRGRRPGCARCAGAGGRSGRCTGPRPWPPHYSFRGRADLTIV